MENKSSNPILSLLFIIASAILLIVSYPKFNYSLLAWFGFVPLFKVLDGQKPKRVFTLSYVHGVLFFLGTLYWFIYMADEAQIPRVLSFLAMILLVLYLSLYFGAFGYFYVLWKRKTFLQKIILLPSVWVVLEFIRDRLFSGFGWVCLGHSQYQVFPLIQIAQLTGVFGISFLVMMVNVFIYEGLKSFKTNKRDFFVPSMVVIVFVGSSFWFGSRILQAHSNEAPKTIKVAIIQPNIAQQMKWDESAWPRIMERLQIFTEEVVGAKPDLIIWPESSYPGYIWKSPEMFARIQNLVDRMNIPLLLGAVTKDGDTYYNSAILISKEGKVVDQYDKLQLVPFGEYIPFRKIFPYLVETLGISDITPGQKEVHFPIQKHAGKLFSVLICFEDTVPRVVRRFTKQGTNLLINITNDAWFGDSKAPFLHMQSAVFRTVEHGKSLIRATNTGVSCFIDQFGRIQGFVENSDGKKTYVPGFAIQDVVLTDQYTFYTKYGDIFTYLCFALILFGIITKNNTG